MREAFCEPADAASTFFSADVVNAYKKPPAYLGLR